MERPTEATYWLEQLLAALQDPAERMEIHRQLAELRLSLSG